MNSATRILVTGAGGFIGHHLVKRLKAEGYWVRGVDLKEPDFEPTAADDFRLLDLRLWHNTLQATAHINQVYNLAADMGGIGYITSKLADIARNNILINAHMLEAARLNGVKRYLYSSSACVYAAGKQNVAEVMPLKEEDAYPADPEPGYGWEKLFTEQLCQYYHSDYGFETRIVRFHNVYGPLGTYEGGKEKAPAAICRKVAMTAPDGTIDIWGDGQQTRSFMFIDDCLEGLLRLMASPYREPLNLGTEEMVSVDELVDMVCGIAGKRLRKRHQLDRPQGVRGRNSDNSRLRTCWDGSPLPRCAPGWRLPIAGSKASCTMRGVWMQSWHVRQFDPSSPQTVDILGVAVHAIDMDEAVRRCQHLLDGAEQGYVCVTGVHGIMEAQRDPAFRKILNRSFLCTPDGMPTVWIGRLHGHSGMGRVYGPDFMLEMCRNSVQRGCRHFLYGGGPGTVEQLAARLKLLAPGIRIVGAWTPPFRALSPAEEEGLVARIAAARPDMIWVGLSTPKQERFMAQMLHRMDTRLMVGVGAAFDIHAGLRRDAPAWIKTCGLQWLHRLLQEPRRLWRRYFVNNPQFVFQLALQLAGRRNENRTS